MGYFGHWLGGNGIVIDLRCGFESQSNFLTLISTVAPYKNKKEGVVNKSYID